MGSAVPANGEVRRITGEGEVVQVAAVPGSARGGNGTAAIRPASSAVKPSSSSAALAVRHQWLQLLLECESTSDRAPGFGVVIIGYDLIK